MIKPPKKKRLIQAWRSYRRWWLEQAYAVTMQTRVNPDGTNDIYLCVMGVEPRYIGTFRTTTCAQS